MLKLYDHLDELLEHQQSIKMHTMPYRHLVSELMDMLGYSDKNDLHAALMRAFETCCVLQIPIAANFRKVYRYHENAVEIDWQVSDLGCYLLLINGNTCNPHVAKAQLQAILSSMRKT